MQLRDAQVGALRRGYVARRICEQLEQAGGEGRFEPATGVVHASDPVGRTSRLQLGLDGLPEAHTTPLGRLSRLRYSKQEILTELIEPSGRHTQLSCDEERAPTLFSRDGVELASFHWNAAHTESAIEFWDGSRASSSFSPGGNPLRLTNRAGASESFTYDAQNRLVALQDGRGKQIGFSYDEQGRPATTRYPDGRAETAQYDPAGSWSGTLLNGKLVFERKADAANRPLAVTYADGRKDGFFYDDQGRLLSAEGPEGALAFAYDGQGRVVSETSGDQVFKFEYDASGLLTAIDYPGGLRAQYQYDADKRLTSVGWGSGSVQFSYDLQDREVWSSSSNQLTTRTELAPSQKPTRVTTRDERSGAVRFDTVYRYDQQDRLSASNERDRGVRQYVYDGESQLLGVANGEGHWLETFAYDGAGNRTAASGQSVTVDAGNRLLRQGNHSCKYDRRGNLVGISDGLRTWRFKYDLKNQMTQADGPAGIVKFKYDALGRRIEKKSAERTIRYLWCGEGVAREIITTEAGESVREYLYRPGSYEPVALLVDGRCYFYHNDHQGTPQRLTDNQGVVVWAADYYAFGYADVRVGLVDNPLRFAGQYSDVETGLHYNRFRYYSPLFGRYFSVDPLRLLAGTNLYLYAGNNPVNKLDPLGLWSALGVLGAVVAAAAVVTLAPFVLVAAPLLVAGALIAAEAISVGRDFCWPCFKSGFGDAFGPGLLMGAGFAAGLAVIGAICAPVAAVIGVGVGCYFAYQMLDQYFGWSGGKPFAGNDSAGEEQGAWAFGRRHSGGARRRGARRRGRRSRTRHHAGRGPARIQGDRRSTARRRTACSRHASRRGTRGAARGRSPYRRSPYRRSPYRRSPYRRSARGRAGRGRGHRGTGRNTGRGKKEGRRQTDVGASPGRARSPAARPRRDRSAAD